MSSRTQKTSLEAWIEDPKNDGLLKDVIKELEKSGYPISVNFNLDQICIDALIDGKVAIFKDFPNENLYATVVAVEECNYTKMWIGGFVNSPEEYKEMSDDKKREKVIEVCERVKELMETRFIH